MTPLNIEVWSDIACPWCWVGKRNLETALEQFEHPVTIRWRAFELDPGAPTERREDFDYVGALATKYGRSREQAAEMIEMMRQRGADVGLEFHFERLKAVNTFDAHRVLHSVTDPKLQNALKERFMVAYFRDGEVLSEHDTLVRLAGDVGLDRERVAALLASDETTEETRREEIVAQQLGIRGVPAFIIAGTYAVQGAQPPEALLQILHQAKEATENPAPESNAPVCGPDGCVLPMAG